MSNRLDTLTTDINVYKQRFEPYFSKKFRAFFQNRRILRCCSLTFNYLLFIEILIKRSTSLTFFDIQRLPESLYLKKVNRLST